MDVLGGHQLMNKKRQLMASEAALQNAEIICYYFSAHWCPPCRNFTPVLADCYTVKMLLKNFFGRTFNLNF